MARWFWLFMLYSFFGFVLEVIFARVTHNPKRDRKCFYFLPLCPVYGLGALAILALPTALRAQPLLLFVCAALSATAVEYTVGLFYEKVAKVAFWDYSHLPLNIGGKVCLLFTAFWGLLGLGLVHGAQPLIEAAVVLIPASWALPGFLFLALDMGFTLIVLRRAQRPEALQWYLHMGHRARQHN